MTLIERTPLISKRRGENLATTCDGEMPARMFRLPQSAELSCGPLHSVEIYNPISATTGILNYNGESVEMNCLVA